MEIIREKNENILTLKLIGRLDTNTSPQLENEIRNKLDGITDLTLDFSELQYISSAGLRVLLTAKKTMNARDGRLVLTNVSTEIMDIMELTGFSAIMTIR